MHTSGDQQGGTAIHRKDLGRTSWSQLRLNARKRKALRLLKQLSNEHLASGNKQLVVFSYDLIGHRINLDGVYEGENLGLLFDWLQPFRDQFLDHGCAVDIGANIGNHSLYFSRHFHQVVSFEPNPRTFQLLQTNAGFVGNVTCHNAAISDTERDGLLDVRHHNTGVSKVAEKATSDTVAIRLKKLDYFVGDLDNIKLVKIDVEGHEAQVLLGSESVLRKNRPLVMFEQHKTDFVNGTTRSIDILKSYGYENFAVIESFPPRLMFLPRPIRRMCQSVLKMIFGEHREIRIKKTFEPQFYAFIIAIPDWALPK